jgi:hypothetical protein
MRTVTGFRMFDRADWRRKARSPKGLHRMELEKLRAGTPTDRKTTEKW